MIALLCRIASGIPIRVPDLPAKAIWLVPVSIPRASRFPLKSMETCMTRSIVRNRNLAFARQSGCCIYCGYQMWSVNPVKFALRHRLALKQAKHYQCTAEHLEARKDGGTTSVTNIVAACRFCNSRRHRRKVALPPDGYKLFVRTQISQGRWHCLAYSSTSHSAGQDRSRQ